MLSVKPQQDVPPTEAEQEAQYQAEQRMLDAIDIEWEFLRKWYPESED